MPDNGGGKNASDSIRIEGGGADLPTSVGGSSSTSARGDLQTSGGDLQAPEGDDLQTPGGNDLQAGELPNLVGAPQNRVDEGAPQATPDTARERIPKSRRHKTVAPTAASERPRRERRAYDPKAFDKEKAPIALAAKSAKTSGRIVEPKTYHEAITGPDKKKWMAAIREELIALISKGTWVRRKLPKGKNLVTSKWVFKVKYKQDGTIERFKARLVARGFTQKYGIDYEETFAPTLRYESLRMLIFIVVQFGLVLHQMNVDNAYLLDNLLEEIYLEIPKELTSKNPDEALLLQKGLYGLKQSDRVWNQKLSKFLASMGSQPTFSDPCVFVNAKKHLIIAFYVDDLLVIGKTEEAVKSRC